MRIKPTQTSTKPWFGRTAKATALSIGLLAMCNPATAQRTLKSGVELDNQDLSISAGQDFYERINKGWLENTEIPDDRTNYGSFSVLDDNAKAEIRKLIESAAANPDATGARQQVGNLYQSYVATETRDEKGISPVLPIIEKIQATENKSEWMRVAGELNRVGIGQIFGGGVGVDARNSSQYTVYVGQGGTTLPDRDYYLEDKPEYKKVLEEFKTYIHDMMVFARHPDPAQAAEDVFALESAFAEIQWERVRLRNPIETYNKKTHDEFLSMISNMDLLAYLEGAQIPIREEWIVSQPSFFISANEIFESATLEQLQSFLLFSAIDNYAPYLSSEIEKRHFAFHSTVLSGVEVQLPLWRRGVELCNGLLGMPIGQIYVKENFPPEAKERMQSLVENLKLAFAERIKSLDWMGDGTKQQALEKLAKFTTKIGYPEKWKDYSSVSLSADDLVSNIQTIAEFEHNYDLKKLGKPIDRTEWFMPPQTVNAYYNPTMNEIVFPAAILQPPFFNLAADDAVNYGAIGAVIGHEISHGFDDSGSKFDGDGNLRNWWTPEDREEFTTRAQKLVEQYSSYEPFEGQFVNGEFTLGENIGDLGGLNVAHAAYQMSLEGKEAAKIDGLTGNERFFAGWAQVWRRKYRPEELKKRLVTDPHSPSRYRCNGIVGNMDVWYETFGVTEGELFIAPEDRVSIW